jgi:cellobiose dehydrogenase (acceptor)
MRFPGVSTLLLALAPLAQYASAQATTPYTDPDTGIVFDSWTAPAGLTWGFAFPANAATVDATELIGIIRSNSPAGPGTGWAGLSFGGSMTRNLLLMAYPQGDEILTAFQWATGWELPVPYTGEVELTQISSKINDDSWELIYRCVGCLSWTQGDVSGKASTSSGLLVQGWAFSSANPTNGACPADVVMQQHQSQNIFGAPLTSASKNALYSEWTKLATRVVPGDCDDSPPPTTTTSAGPTATPVPTNAVYDYVVVGAGAGGIPIADRLSEAGKKVLLIEKGPVSTGRWGGTRRPSWLDPTGLTRFDVPGLCNEIWADPSGIKCEDTDQMAGCILGGGTAINAGLWWRPKDADWDYNFPTGWKATDMAGPARKVFGRIPGTRVPSQDGKRYLPGGRDGIANGLKAAGWKEVNPFTDPNSKNLTYTDGPYMFKNAERDGPLATYLVSADARNNFDLWTDTQVEKIVRKGGHASALEVKSPSGRGFAGTVKLTPNTGRVIVSSGTFGSAKLLLRSGIGPEDQLTVVAGSASDGPTYIAKDDWIKLPVGYNLEDHTNTDMVVSHPSAQFYDFYEAFDTPIPADRDAYLNKRSGILAQAAPNIGPVFFDEIKGTDNIVRSFQYTARVENSLGHNDTHAITISQYLGRGAVSRGRMTIDSSLTTLVSTIPYLKNQADTDAVVASIEKVRKALGSVSGLKFLSPADGTSSADYVKNTIISTSNRRANHWIGTNKLGTKDGRQSGGDAVVDLNTKVWGTDNIFVVDASIFPGMITTNPSSYIVTVSERAAERILALAPATPGAQFAQCGGQTWNGSFYCQSGLTCKKVDSYYSQCLK